MLGWRYFDASGKQLHQILLSARRPTETWIYWWQTFGKDHTKRSLYDHRAGYVTLLKKLNITGKTKNEHKIWNRNNDEGKERKKLAHFWMLDAGKHQQQRKKLLLCRPISFRFGTTVHTMYAVTYLYVRASYSTPVNCINTKYPLYARSNCITLYRRERLLCNYIRSYATKLMQNYPE